MAGIQDAVAIDRVNGFSQPSVLPSQQSAGSIFSIDRVQLQFTVNYIVSLVVSNNILCMALKTGRIIRIDLDHPQDVDDVDLPKKSSEIGQISNIFLDPTGSLLIISTSMGENYCLSYQSTKPRPLGRLKGLHITSVAWSPIESTRSTGDILIGTQNGVIYETFIEPSDEYFKREDRYLRQVWTSPTGEPVTGLFAYAGKHKSTRNVIATIGGQIYFWQSKVSNHSGTDVIPVYPRFFQKEEPVVEAFGPASKPIAVSVTPKPSKASNRAPILAWLHQIGILLCPLTSEDLSQKDQIFKDSQIFLSSELPESLSNSVISGVLLSEFHIILLCDTSDIVAVNRLNNQVVFHDKIPLTGQESIIGLCADRKKSTYWAYSEENIFEIVVNDEDREIWKTLLHNGEYEEALRLTKDFYSRDIASIAYGDHLLESKQFTKAAEILGSCSKPFETVALSFMEAGQYDALQKYLEVKLNNFPKGSHMQRVMITSWIIEIFMEKLNTLDDLNATADFSVSAKKDSEAVVQAYHSFVKSHKDDLDKDTVYEILSGHSRGEELLYYASSINDHNFVLSYWIKLEKWSEALHVIRVESDPKITYKYANVLLMNAPKPTVDTWMRMPDLDPARFVPAILSYVSGFRSNDVRANQGIRYLKFAIENLKTRDPIIHNTLIVLYASNPAIDELPLVEFLESNGGGTNPSYNADFALRICTKFSRVQASVHIFSSMGLYEEAVRLALKHNNSELASVVADRPVDNPELRKSLWLIVAKEVIKKPNGFKFAVELLNRCELLKIEDLLPLFPDFAIIDDFKSEITASMESYNLIVNQLNRDMEDSVNSSENIKKEIEKFRKRYVLIEPGESCAICGFPLCTRRFYVFSCQHAFHCDCLLDSVLHSASDYKLRKRINEVQMNLTGGGKESAMDLIDQALLEKCLLCGESRIDTIDRPLIEANKADSSWAL